MEYFAMIGLLFAPVICLLCTGWFFVRWKNEHENEALAQKNRKICLRSDAGGAGRLFFGAFRCH